MTKTKENKSIPGQSDPWRETLYDIIFWSAVPLVLVGILYGLHVVGVPL